MMVLFSGGGSSWWATVGFFNIFSGGSGAVCLLILAEATGAFSLDSDAILHGASMPLCCRHEKAYMGGANSNVWAAVRPPKIIVVAENSGLLPVLILETIKDAAVLKPSKPPAI